MRQPSSMPLAAMWPVPPPWRLRGDGHGLVVWMPGGRPGLMLFVRYLDSNVGPYDELLWLDAWGRSLGTRRRHTVSRIYVSTEASVFNGRVNWGIPKELATFSVTSLGALSERVEVTSTMGEVASFSYRSSRRSLPVDAGLLPARWRALVQVADGRSFETLPSARGRMHRARFFELTVNPLLFPDVSQGRVLGAFSLRKFEMLFPIPKIESA
jgi:hypothetical protein